MISDNNNDKKQWVTPEVTSTKIKNKTAGGTWTNNSIGGDDGWYFS